LKHTQGRSDERTLKTGGDIAIHEAQKCRTCFAFRSNRQEIFT
jgi:hypothetical protein